MAPLNRVTKSEIDPLEVLKSVGDPSAGGTVLFLGTVRNRSEGKRVVGLEYDVYSRMAEKKMREIEKRARERWSITRIAMVHRYGRLKIGEVSVAVAASSEHRAEAFQACRFAIDTIKRTLPIWKKERFAGGGGDWVKGNPITE